VLPLAGSALLGLCAILDVAEPHKRILFVSYGSGAGSDAYLFYTTPLLPEKRKRTEKFNTRYQATSQFLEYVDYDTYRRFKAGI
jgi:hydroxymethylglutaryl-CoA synthase